MNGWIYVPSNGVFLNLAQVTNAQPTANPGHTRFTLTVGGTVDITLGATDADAQEALRRLVDAVDPTTYI